MNIRKSSETEILIGKLKNIIRIRYIDIMTANATGRNRIIPGFDVDFVADGKSQNLCLYANNAGFDLFVKRLKEVYEEEKDGIVSIGIMGPQGIQITPKARQLLLGGELEVVSNYYQEFQDKEGYPDSLFFEEDEVKALFPMIEYHIREVAKQFNISYGNMKISNGINGVYSIATTIRGIPTTLPIYFQKEDETYVITVGNVLEKSRPIWLDISFLKDGLKVTVLASDIEYYEFHSYLIEKDVPTKKKEILYKNCCIAYESEHMKKVDQPENILAKDDLTRWYSLPWDAFIGVSDHTDHLSDTEYTFERRMYYVHRNDDSYFEQEKSSKRYYQIPASNHYYYPIDFDSIDKTVIGMKQDGILLFETHFMNPMTVGFSRPMGFYQDYLLDHYFYSVSSAPSWGEVKDGQKYLCKKDGFEDPVDLLDVKKLEKKVNE